MRLLSGLVILSWILSVPSGVRAQVTMINTFDSLDDISGATLVADPRQEGTGAVAWDNGQATRLSWTPPAPLDLSGYDTITFWLHANQPHAAGGGVLIYLGSENPASDGADYYHLQLPIEFTGWQFMELDRSALSPSRSPRGWDQIDDFQLIASGWDNTPDESLVLTLDALAGEVLSAPRTSDEELFAAMDLSYPRLEAVASAVAADDLDSARTELCAHFRSRVEPTWRVDGQQPDSSISYSQSLADSTVDRTFTIGGYTYTFPDGVIDWSYNPTLDDPSAADNHEWQWQLGRMGYWPNLGRAWWATGDSRYAQAFAEQLDGFVTTRPMPSQAANGAGSSWRTIEAGIRMTYAWPDAWHYFLHADAHFDQERMILMAKSLLEHGRYLRLHQTSANWLTHEMGGLYTVGALFPEFSEASDWRSFAVDIMVDAMAEQFLEDGGHYELTPHYHRITVDYMRGLHETATITGRADELPSNYLEPLRAAYLWLLAIATPDLNVPQLNDCTDEDVARTAQTAQVLFPDEQAFTWAASGRQGPAPDFTSLHLPHSGLVIARSGWEEDDHYALMDVGPFSRGHSHQDKLQVLYYPHGRRMLFDNGGGNYEASVYRTYGLASASHNTVLVDGQGQKRARSDSDPLGWGDPTTPPAVFASEPGWVYAQGSYQDAYGDSHPARHRREMLFVDPHFLLLVDSLAPTDDASHTYQARWHLLTTEWQEQSVRAAVISSDADQPNLVVQPLNTANLTVRTDSGLTSPEVLGWDLDHAGGRHPALTLRHERQGSGEQRFITLLWPLASGESDPIAQVEEQSADSFLVTLNDGSTLLVELPFAPDPGIRLVYQQNAQEPLEILVDPDDLSVEEEPPTDGGDGGPADGEDGSQDGAPDGAPDGSSDAGDDATPDGDQDQPDGADESSQVAGGCSCGTPQARPMPALLLMLVGLALLRRRRKPT